MSAAKTTRKLKAELVEEVARLRNHLVNLGHACRQCGRTEVDEFPDGHGVVLVGCDICFGPACDEHARLSDGEWCCSDHDPDAGWDDEPNPESVAALGENHEATEETR